MTGTATAYDDRVPAAVVNRIAAEWVAEFGSALERLDLDTVERLFLPDGYWRDLLALTWDLRTLHGQAAIRAALEEHLDTADFASLTLDVGKAPAVFQFDASTTWIEGFFDFETAVAHGRGILRLMRDGAGDWRAWNVLTTIRELKGYESPRGERRPLGHSDDSASETRQNWLDRRARQREFLDADPHVFVIGAGQGGLALAANLGLLGVDTLVIEKNERVGDNWRKRYHSLVLHDPVWADHLPYLPFPDSWPVYTPKDKLADWLELYASAMELNVWTGTELVEGSYQDALGHWTVRVARADGSMRVLQPAHVVLATGVLGEPNLPHLECMATFGGTICHSSSYADGHAWAGRKAVVVGACNSGHDIAQDLYQCGADVTLVQRSSTYVMTQKNGIPVLFGGLYHEGGPPTEDADLLNAAFPYSVVLEFSREQTAAIAQRDRELLEGLERAGFKLDMGTDGGGLMSKALERGGGYYIDVGCSQLIADGMIRVKQGAAITRMTENGLELDDGSLIEADLIVLATGYTNMRETARRLFGDEVADRVEPVWGLDAEGELRTIWRNSGHPGFWFMGGPLVMARIYSKLLALQIKAIQEGVINHPALSVR